MKVSASAINSFAFFATAELAKAVYGLVSSLSATTTTTTTGINPQEAMMKAEEASLALGLVVFRTKVLVKIFGRTVHSALSSPYASPSVAVAALRAAVFHVTEPLLLARPPPLGTISPADAASAAAATSFSSYCRRHQQQGECQRALLLPLLFDDGSTSLATSLAPPPLRHHQKQMQNQPQYPQQQHPRQQHPQQIQQQGERRHHKKNRRKDRHHDSRQSYSPNRRWVWAATVVLSREICAELFRAFLVSLAFAVLAAASAAGGFWALLAAGAAVVTKLWAGTLRFLRAVGLRLTTGAPIALFEDHESSHSSSSSLFRSSVGAGGAAVAAAAYGSGARNGSKSKQISQEAKQIKNGGNCDSGGGGGGGKVPYRLGAELEGLRCVARYHGRAHQRPGTILHVRLGRQGKWEEGFSTPPPPSSLSADSSSSSSSSPFPPLGGQGVEVAATSYSGTTTASSGRTGRLKAPAAARTVVFDVSYDRDPSFSSLHNQHFRDHKSGGDGGGGRADIEYGVPASHMCVCGPAPPPPPATQGGFMRFIHGLFFSNSTGGEKRGGGESGDGAGGGYDERDFHLLPPALAVAWFQHRTDAALAAASGMQLGSKVLTAKEALAVAKAARAAEKEGSVARRKAAEVAAEEEEAAAAAARVVRCCLEAHPLVGFTASASGWACSGPCGRTFNKPGKVLFGCRACDFDLCRSCVKTSALIKEAAAPPPPPTKKKKKEEKWKQKEDRNAADPFLAFQRKTDASPPNPAPFRAFQRADSVKRDSKAAKKKKRRHDSDGSHNKKKDMLQRFLRDAETFRATIDESGSVDSSSGSSDSSVSSDSMNSGGSSSSSSASFLFPQAWTASAAVVTKSVESTQVAPSRWARNATTTPPTTATIAEENEEEDGSGDGGGVTTCAENGASTAAAAAIAVVIGSGGGGGGSGGVVKEKQQELAKWEAAALQGHAHAQYCLARAYSTGSRERFGLGAEPNFEVAAKWYKAAAEQGYADAQVIGACFDLMDVDTIPTPSKEV
jgi:hypothetical protein